MSTQLANSQNVLAILGDGYSIAITPDAIAIRDGVVNEAKKIIAVTDAASCETAQSRIKSLAELRIGAEKSREIVKRPVIALGKEIDGIAKDYTAEVHVQEARLSGLVNEYAREQQRIQREAQLAAERERQRIERERHEAAVAAQQEQMRIERERMEAERKTHEAEMARLRAEAAQSDEAQAVARQKQEAALAEQRATEYRLRAAQATAEAEAYAARQREQAAAQAARIAAEAATATPAGVSEQVDFEVIDVHAFAVKFPQLVTFIPKRAEILAALKKSYAKNGKLPEVPGLRVFQNLRVRGR
jgi:hypothetical protein